MRSISPTNSVPQLDPTDPDSLTAFARHVVASAAKRMNLPFADGGEHYEDMVNTALAAVLTYAGRGERYAYTAARTSVQEYIATQIYQVGAGWQREASRGYRIVSIEAVNRHNERAFDYLFFDYHRCRPLGPRWTENTLIRRENGQENDATFWEAAEKELLYVLAGLQTRLYPDSLILGARVFSLLCQGYTYPNIEELLALPVDLLWATTTRYRADMERYLALSSLHRAAVRVAGEKSICHWSDLSEARLRSVSRLVVILPDHGSVTVFTRPKQTCVSAYLQQYATYQGRRRKFTTTLGPIQHLDYARLRQGMAAMQARVAGYTAAGVQ
jgi:hypothetical protein